MVDEVGLEPTMPFGRKIYSLLGLPIFLHIHNGGDRLCTGMTHTPSTLSAYLCYLTFQGGFTQVISFCLHNKSKHISDLLLL